MNGPRGVQGRRALSLAVTAAFAALCVGTSKAPTPSATTGGLGSGGAAFDAVHLPVHIPHSAPVKGRIDPSDAIRAGSKSRYDAFIVQLAGATSYRVTVHPDAPDGGAPPPAGSLAASASPPNADSAAPAPGSAAASAGPDSGPAPELGPLWFSVAVLAGDCNNGTPVSVLERVHDDGNTESTFTTTVPGAYCVVVTAFFGHGADAKPAFSTYELEVRPSAVP